MLGLARMRKLLVLVLFAAACGGGSSAAPATASTTPPAAAASSDVFAVKDMTFFEGNDPVMHVSKDGHIEIQTKHVQNGSAATTDNQFVGVIAADGSVSDPTGAKRGQLGADGSFKSPDGQTAPFTLANDALVMDGVKVTIDDHGALLKDGKAITPPVRVEGVTDAASRRTALFVMALVFASAPGKATATGESH